LETDASLPGEAAAIASEAFWSQVLSLLIRMVRVAVMTVIPNSAKLGTRLASQSMPVKVGSRAAVAHQKSAEIHMSTSISWRPKHFTLFGGEHGWPNRRAGSQ
jgi:hypothetical protein